jgi:hypothetical protein
MNSETAFLTRDDDPSVFANKRGSSLSQLPYPVFGMWTWLFCALRQIVLVLVVPTSPAKSWIETP